MRFSQSFLDDIRTRIPIADVVGRRVSWDKKKSLPQRGDYWACCPFHGEKTPSFHADNRRGRYHCFGCGVSGDHFTFLVEQEGMTFPQAVEILAAEAGLALPALDPEMDRKEKRRSTLLQVLEIAAAFFREQLNAEVGARARSYLAGRGLAGPVQSRFGIGFAPDSRNALKRHLAASGIDHDQMVEAGLLISGDDIPVSYDRFRDRVMFPIADLRGRVIAFGGRAISSDVPAKYLNSPETPLFQKRRVLFNGHTARKSARAGASVIAVEGYTDVIACVAAGFEATVAPLGTALTEDQLRLLWQMADEPIMCFDGDEAGQKAAYRAADVALSLLEPGKSLRFVLLPEGRDPDDILRQEGAPALQEYISHASPLIDLVWRRATEGRVFDTPERRAALSAGLRELATSIGDSSVRHHYNEALRERINLLFGSAGPTRRKSSSSGAPGQKEWRQGRPAGPSESLKNDPLTRRKSGGAGGELTLHDAILIGTLINHPQLAADRVEALGEANFSGAECARLAQRVAIGLSEQPDISRQDLLDLLKDRGLHKTVSEIMNKLTAAGLRDLAPEGDLVRAAAIWDDALHLRLRSRLLSIEKKIVAKTIAEEGGERELSRLRDIQAQDSGLGQPKEQGESSQQTLAHPLKAGH